MKSELLKAARAHAIPAGEDGLWSVRKFTLSKPLVVNREQQNVLLPPDTYTQLFCLTESTMHLLGECVMHDTPEELNKHLQFMLLARGSVLITGLGLGCVVRGTLANPNVTHVTCIERSPSIMKLVAPYMPKERLTIIEADALEWVKRPGEWRFDCAWHDLWSNPDRKEPHLQVNHMQMICDLISSERVAFQGAWAFPKDQRRLMKPLNVI